MLFFSSKSFTFTHLRVLLPRFDQIWLVLILETSTVAGTKKTLTGDDNCISLTENKLPRKSYSTIDSRVTLELYIFFLTTLSSVSALHSNSFSGHNHFALRRLGLPTLQYNWRLLSSIRHPIIVVDETLNRSLFLLTSELTGSKDNSSSRFTRSGLGAAIVIWHTTRIIANALQLNPFILIYILSSAACETLEGENDFRY